MKKIVYLLLFLFMTKPHKTQSQEQPLYPPLEEKPPAASAPIPIAYAPGYNQRQPGMHPGYQSYGQPPLLPQQQKTDPYYQRQQEYYLPVGSPPQNYNPEQLAALMAFQEMHLADSPALKHTVLYSPGSSPESGIDSPISPQLTGEAVNYFHKIIRSKQQLLDKFRKFLDAREQAALKLCNLLQEQQGEEFDLEALSEQTKSKKQRAFERAKSLRKSTVDRYSESVKQKNKQTRDDHKPFTDGLEEHIGLMVRVAGKITEFFEEGAEIDKKCLERQRKRSNSLSSLSSPRMSRRASSPALPTAQAPTPPPGYPEQTRGFQTLGKSPKRINQEEANA